MLICYHFENSQKLIHRIEVVAAIRTRGGELGVVQRWLPACTSADGSCPSELRCEPYPDLGHRQWTKQRRKGKLLTLNMHGNGWFSSQQFPQSLQVQ